MSASKRSSLDDAECCVLRSPPGSPRANRRQEDEAMRHAWVPLCSTFPACSVCVRSYERFLCWYPLCNLFQLWHLISNTSLQYLHQRRYWMMREHLKGSMTPERGLTKHNFSSKFLLQRSHIMILCALSVNLYTLTPRLLCLVQSGRYYDQAWSAHVSHRQ